MTLPSSTKIAPDALPRSKADQVAWLQLARSRRVGPVTFIRLMREYGNAADAVAALPKIAADAGAKNYAPATAEAIKQEITTGEAYGASLRFLGMAGYPAALTLIDDPPPVLWIKGNADLLQRDAVALVGARNASSLGQRMADRLAKDLGEARLVVTSGLARGVDTAAHKAALATGTIAVVAGGIDVTYPRENADLMASIAQDGLIVSEMPMGLVPQARHFPRRNRIISGLSQAVVVVEGAAKSGSLITARTALDQGREVMAIPGHPFDARTTGCNMLIRDGATLVRSGEDVITALSCPPVHQETPSQPAPLPPSPAAMTEALPATLLDLLGPSPVAEDLLIRQTGHPAPQVLEALMLLELEAQIERHPGGLISRVA
ncbi:DNA-processing protein DprA [Halovulum sp. GXIMD14793]